MLEGNNEVNDLLQYLEGQTVMLSDTEQDYILGCRMTLDTGGGLTPGNLAELHRIARSLNYAGHNAVGGLAEGVLSMQKVIKDLAGAIHMLTPQEQQVFKQLAAKVQGGTKLAVGEVEALLQIYGAKGF